MSLFKALTDGKKRNLIYTIKRYKSSKTRIDTSVIISDNIKKGIDDQLEWLKA